MDEQKLFEGIYNIQKDLKGVKEELNGVKGELKSLMETVQANSHRLETLERLTKEGFEHQDERLGKVEASLSILVQEAHENKVDIVRLKNAK